jgi:hypothetical protein
MVDNIVVSAGNEHDVYVAQRRRFSVLLRVDEAQWRSRAQAEGVAIM